MMSPIQGAINYGREDKQIASYASTDEYTPGWFFVGIFAIVARRKTLALLPGPIV